MFAHEDVFYFALYAACVAVRAALPDPKPSDGRVLRIVRAEADMVCSCIEPHTKPQPIPEPQKAPERPVSSEHPKLPQQSTHPQVAEPEPEPEPEPPHRLDHALYL